MSGLPFWPPLPPPPPGGDPFHPLAAVLPPPSSSASSSGNSVSPSLLIIGAILLFVILASVSIHLLLRLLSGRRSGISSSSARVFSTPSLSEESFAHHLQFPAQTERNEESNEDHNKEKADALIQALPLFTLASSLAALPKSSPDCAVCLSPFDPTAELRLLPACRHAFHANCIDTWLRSSTPSCPLCRASVHLPFPPLPSAPSFRVELGSVSRRQTTTNENQNQNQNSSSSRRSYSIGSFDYRIEDEIEAVISRIQRLKDEKNEDPTAQNASAPSPPGQNIAEIAGTSHQGSWLRDYVDRLASSASSSFNSLKFSSNRWSSRWSSRQDNVAGRWDVEAAQLAEQSEEEEMFYSVYRWIIGV